MPKTDIKKNVEITIGVEENNPAKCFCGFTIYENFRHEMVTDTMCGLYKKLLLPSHTRCEECIRDFGNGEANA